MLKKILAVTALGIATVAYGNGDIKVFQGLGKDVMFRVGPGKDEKGVPVYSFNYTTASVLFDKDGKIISADVDTLEVSTPNYDGESMPHFSGWPGKEGYNLAEHGTKKIVGISDNSVEAIKLEVDGWKTKRERGQDYGMNPRNEWFKQMENFEKFFVGKTVDDIEKIFKRTFSDVNGRPIKATATNEKDKEKYMKLSAEDKAMLVDLTAGATMSIKDSHGDIINAMKNAYQNKTEVLVPTK
ncbi:MAG: FMN-binding protein [Fusobacteriaceae bacterium]